jgi:hypothetical protein
MKMREPAMVSKRAVLLVGQVVVALWCQASHAAAQQSLGDLLSFLITNQSIPTGDFVKDAQAGETTRAAIARLLTDELAVLPASVSSPALVYRFNSSLGVAERVTDQFGPFFSERALTVGRGEAAFGISLRVSQFDRLDHRDLRDGAFVTTANRFRDEQQPFDVDRLTLDLSARTATAFATVGLTDAIDLGVALRLVSLSLSGTRVETYRGSMLTQARAEADVTGLGDSIVRAKWQMWKRPHAGGVAALVEGRLPTGDKDDLLGAGQASLRVLAIASMERPRLGIDVNGGFTAGAPTDEVQVSVATSVMASPRLTVVGELLGRHIPHSGRLSTIAAPHPDLRDVETIRLVTEPGALSVAAVVTGAKWNVTGPWLIHGSVSWPLSGGGLHTAPVAQVGLEYALVP